MQRVAQRSNLSDEIAAAVREMIVDGTLPAGERLNEVRLAERLGVSRTPLREALARLVAEGAVTSVARLGFYVCPLSAEELVNLYPMRGLLDPAALRSGGLPPPERIERLKALNARLADARDPMEAVRLDDEWHLELLGGCTNTILLGFIDQMMWRTRRYELALMRERANLARTTEDHEAVIAALAGGELDEACAALERNMSSGLEPLLEWLKQREERE